MKNYIKNPLLRQEQELNLLLFNHNTIQVKNEKSISIDVIHKEIFRLFQKLKTTKNY